MRADSDMVAVKTRQLEELLKTQYHAEGAGLVELVSSCQQRLPHDVINKLYYIAEVEDKINQSSFDEMDDSQDFIEAYKQCVRELVPRSSKFIWRFAVFFMTVVTLAALVLYYIHWEKVESHFLR